MIRLVAGMLLDASLQSEKLLYSNVVKQYGSSGTLNPLVFMGLNENNAHEATIHYF